MNEQETIEGARKDVAYWQRLSDWADTGVELLQYETELDLAITRLERLLSKGTVILRTDAKGYSYHGCCEVTIHSGTEYTVVSAAKYPWQRTVIETAGGQVLSVESSEL